MIEGVNEPEEDERSLRAWKWFARRPVNLDNVLLLHKKIMHKKLGKEAGHLRIWNVRVGDRVCPHYENVPKLINNWIRLHNNTEPFTATEESIKLAHIEFEKIHPFIDGNGRTGRMIMNNQRIKAGLLPLCIKAVERWDYYRWFM